jgi:hypothetical protein
MDFTSSPSSSNRAAILKLIHIQYAAFGGTGDSASDNNVRPSSSVMPTAAVVLAVGALLGMFLSGYGILVDLSGRSGSPFERTDRRGVV